MGEPVEDPVKPDMPPEPETEIEGDEGSKYRSFYDDTKNKAKLKQKFKIGRVVWLKTDMDGSYRMMVTDAAHNAASNSWSYLLEDSMGDAYGGWIAETKLTAANPGK